MRKILFACDLDNTLIHSYKKRQPSDICVELYNGGQQSFMTAYAVKLFAEILENENIYFLPVTTRSVEQFNRIELPFSEKIKHALVSNGGNLLAYGNINQQWKSETDSIINPYKKEIVRIFELFKGNENIRTTKIVDERFVFWAFENQTDACSFKDAVKEQTSLCIEVQGRKVYAFPDFLNKGRAVLEYMKKYGFNYLVAAGDSSIDLSMLSIADTAIVPSGFCPLPDSRNILVNEHENFSEFLLNSVLKLIKE